MPYVNEPRDYSVRLQTAGGIKFGIDKGLLVQGDLTSKANAINAVNAKTYIAGVPPTLLPIWKNVVIASLNAIDDFVTNFTSSSDLSLLNNIAVDSYSNRFARRVY